MTTRPEYGSMVPVRLVKGPDYALLRSMLHSVTCCPWEWKDGSKGVGPYPTDVSTHPALDGPDCRCPKQPTLVANAETAARLVAAGEAVAA